MNINANFKKKQVMYNGEPSKGKDFFNLLLESEEFTSELGKVTLAAGMLEAELILFLRGSSVEDKNLEKATLGQLINLGRNKGLFAENMEIALVMLKDQRNYLTHSIYALFIDSIDETILEKNNLLDSDVHIYTERAWQLKENLLRLADIFQKQNDIGKESTS